MNIQEILSKVDHTLLSVTATQKDIKALCIDAKKYKCASVCVPPSFVRFASECLQGEIPVCTVIGFPNGYSAKEVKAFETAKAIADGADEIDMVINIGDLKAKNYDKILTEINAVKYACGDKILKVIIETCLLTDAEKKKMCEIVSNSDADFIKTSTGFSSGGATKQDIKLFKKHITNGKKIKAAGGISSIEDAKEFINLGANRLGTSKIVKLVKGGATDENSTY